jgi:hypothetical protein
MQAMIRHYVLAALVNWAENMLADRNFIVNIEDTNI